MDLVETRAVAIWMPRRIAAMEKRVLGALPLSVGRAAIVVPERQGKELGRSGGMVESKDDHLLTRGGLRRVNVDSERAQEARGVERDVDVGVKDGALFGFKLKIIGLRGEQRVGVRSIEGRHDPSMCVEKLIAPIARKRWR